MSQSVELMSSHTITDDDVIEIIAHLGDDIKAVSNPYYFRFISNNEGGVYLNRSEPYSGVFDEEGNVVSEKAAFLVQQAKVLLGGEVQTSLSLRIGHGRGSWRVAVRFAYACCQHWSCVILTEWPQLFSQQDIEQIYRGGGDFAYHNT